MARLNDDEILRLSRTQRIGHEMEDRARVGDECLLRGYEIEKLRLELKLCAQSGVAATANVTLVTALAERLQKRVEELQAGNSAAHLELDRADITREDSTWSGPVETVTEYPVCDRIGFLVKQRDLARAACDASERERKATQEKAALDKTVDPNEWAAKAKEATDMLAIEKSARKFHQEIIDKISTDVFCAGERGFPVSQLPDKVKELVRQRDAANTASDLWEARAKQAESIGAADSNRARELSHQYIAITTQAAKLVEMDPEKTSLPELLAKLEAANACCKWEADHQRAALLHVGGEALAAEFPGGCDAIGEVAEALLAARKTRDAYSEALSGTWNHDLDKLAARVVAACVKRGWSLDWARRGNYLFLESAELIESLRKKGKSPPEEEMADVLSVLLSIYGAFALDKGKVAKFLYEKLAKIELGAIGAGPDEAPSDPTFQREKS